MCGQQFLLLLLSNLNSILACGHSRKTLKRSPFQKGQKQEVNRISSVSATQMQFPLLVDNIYSKLMAFKEQTLTQFPSSFSSLLNVYLWKTLQSYKGLPSNDHVPCGHLVRHILPTIEKQYQNVITDKTVRKCSHAFSHKVLTTVLRSVFLWLQC